LELIRIENRPDGSFIRVGGDGGGVRNGHRG
jgi:hypothetical protein